MKKCCTLGQLLDKSAFRILFGALSLQLQFKHQYGYCAQCFSSSFYGYFYISSNLVCRFIYEEQDATERTLQRRCCRTDYIVNAEE